jgi:molecular chaperone GrpE
MSARSVSTRSKVEVANPSTRFLDTRLFAEETPEENPVTEEEEEAPKDDSSSSSDILNSPAFLKRKIDVLMSDIAAVDEKLSEANARYEANKAEWGPQLESLSKEYATMQDRLNKDASSGKEEATIQVVQKLLGVLDNYDRAFGVIEAETDDEKEIEAAYKATYDMIMDAFGNLGVKKIETVGQEFDYNLHQAIMTRVSDEYEEGIVCEELAKGYATEEGACLRAAMVVVAA